jgi:uncharacterized protein
MPDPSPDHNPDPAASPCINVCAIGTDGVCLGCFRTLDEIARYSSLPRAGRIAVNEAARRRQSGRGDDAA